MLLRATKSDEIKHSHIAYIRPDGTGITSKSNGHYHEIGIPQGQPDEFAIPGTLQAQPTVLPAGDDNHTHELSEIDIKPSKEEELDDKKELRACIALYQEAKTLNGDSINRAVESENFYKGIQWEEEDRTALKAESRACLTINEIKPKLDMLSGHQRQNRTDIGLLPTEKGDQTTCDIYNLRVKTISTTSNYEYEETRTFEDMTRVGLGAMQVNIIATDDGIGDVEVINKPWETVMFGPHTKMDGSDADYCVIITNLSKAKLQELYPDKADEVQKDYEIIAEDRKIPQSRSDHYIHKGKSLELFEDITRMEPDLVNLAKKSYKMIEVQRKVYKRTPVLYNAKHGFYMNADGMSDKDIEAAISIDEVSKINHVSNNIMITVFAGNVLLTKEKSLFRQFNVVPFYANKVRNDWWGKVHEAKDAQRELNKRASQMIDVINKSASYGLGVTAEAFVDGVNGYNTFAKNKNKPGFVQLFKPGFQEHLHEFQGVKFPQEIVAAAELSSRKIETIMNIHPEMMGGGRAGESGVSIAQKQRAGMTGNEYLFDNFSLSKRRVGHLLIEAIQIIDSPEKLLRISENQNNNTLRDSNPISLYPQVSPQDALGMAVQQGLLPPQAAQAIAQGAAPPEIMQQFQQQIMPAMQMMANKERRAFLLKALENFELSQYDVVVSENTHSPTMRVANYAMIVEMFRGNPGAPWDKIIDMSPFMDQKTKDSLIQGMQANAQAQQEAEQLKYKTELVKTQIAHQPEQQAGTPLT